MAAQHGVNRDWAVARHLGRGLLRSNEEATPRRSGVVASTEAAGGEHTADGERRQNMAMMASTIASTGRSAR